MPRCGFGVSCYPDALNLHLSTRRHHGALMAFLINIRCFKEEKLGQGECWRESGSCLLKTNGGSTDALDLPEAVFVRDLFSDLEILVSCNQIPPLPMSLCQKTYCSWPGQLVRVYPVLITTRALLPGQVCTSILPFWGLRPCRFPTLWRLDGIWEWALVLEKVIWDYTRHY